MLFGAASFFIMPQQATTASFLTEDEKEAVTEMLKGEWTSDDHEPFSWSEIWAACKAPHVLIFIITSFFNGSFSSLSFARGLTVTYRNHRIRSRLLVSLLENRPMFMTDHPHSSPTIVSGLGYSNIRAQLMSVPPYACSFVVSLATAYFSDKFQQRGVALIFSGVLATVGYGMYLGSSDLHVGYGSLFLQNSGVFISAPTVSVW